MMNIRWRTVIGLIIALALGMTLLACGGQKKPDEPPAIPTTAGQAQAPVQQGESYPAPPGGMPPAAPPPAYPAPGATGGQPAQTSVTFTTADGVSLVGTYFEPAQGNAPGAVLVHLVAGQRSDWASLAVTLQSRGFAVLTFDLRGHGESGGSQEWDRMSDDVAVAYQFLSGQPGVDRARVGLVGASIGANLALNFAAAEPGVKAVALLSPGLDYRGVQTEAAMQPYGTRPVLFVASKTDAYAAQTVATLSGLAQGDTKTQFYDDAGHGTQMFGKADGLEDLIANWLRDALGGG